MKRTLLVAFVMCLISIDSLASVATASGYCPYRQCPPTTTTDGYRYSYSNGVFYASGEPGTGMERGVRMEYFYQPTCQGNEVLDASGSGGDVMCGAALAGCEVGEIKMWRFSRPAGSGVPPQREVGTICVGAARAVTLADAQAAFIRYLKDAHLPKPLIVTAPPTGGLVNLPQIFATADSPPVSMAVTVPLPATLAAEPHYAWNFGDGSTGPDTPGRPYQPGVLPADHPDYYLSHTYRTNATVTTTLTVTWHASFTVTGIDQIFPIPDITFTASRTMPVRQARSELVDSP